MQLQYCDNAAGVLQGGIITPNLFDIHTHDNFDLIDCLGFGGRSFESLKLLNLVGKTCLCMYLVGLSRYRNFWVTDSMCFRDVSVISGDEDDHLLHHLNLIDFPGSREELNNL